MLANLRRAFGSTERIEKPIRVFIEPREGGDGEILQLDRKPETTRSPPAQGGSI